MGNFYTNVTVRGPDREQVVAAAEELGYCAFVSHTDAGLTVVCEERSDTQDPDVWRDVARQLSLKLRCPALAMLNHDDDVLIYALYQNGTLLDEYNSFPSYWINQDPPALPRGGNAGVLCEAFGMPGDADEVEHALRTTPHSEDPDPEDDFIFAVKRHIALIGALDWPAVPCFNGFDYLKRKGMPPGWLFVG